MHQTSQGRPVEFEFADESDGTRKIFAFAGPWLDTLKCGGVLTDFHPRKDRENLLANYLDGRYGALPVFGDWTMAYPMRKAS